MPRMLVPVRTLPHFHEPTPLALPKPATAGAAGIDLQAAVAEPRTLAPGARMLVPTGICMAVPLGCEAQVRPRSGLALKQGVTVLNSPGTIDSDYRGEVQVLLINLGQEPVMIERGMRIAQLVLARHELPRWELVDALPSTERGAGGFGSTGVHP
jgi:dUTP pyrophosphatase